MSKPVTMALGSLAAQSSTLELCWVVVFKIPEIEKENSKPVTKTRTKSLEGSRLVKVVILFVSTDGVVGFIMYELGYLGDVVMTYNFDSVCEQVRELVGYAGLFVLITYNFVTGLFEQDRELLGMQGITKDLNIMLITAHYNHIMYEDA